MLIPEVVHPVEAGFSFWEKHGWQYRSRFQETEHIADKITEIVETKTAQYSENIEKFTILVASPPYERAIARQNAINWSIFMEKANLGSQQLYELAGLITNFNALFYYVGTEPGYYHIDLDRFSAVKSGDIDTSLTSSILAHADRGIDFLDPDLKALLRENQTIGYIKGVQLLLEQLSIPEKPLIRWRKEMAESVMITKPTANAGIVGTLPTILTGVAARYYYPNKKVSPEIGLIVDRI